MSNSQQSEGFVEERLEGEGSRTADGRESRMSRNFSHVGDTRQKILF